MKRQKIWYSRTFLSQDNKKQKIEGSVGENWMPNLPLKYSRKDLRYLCKFASISFAGELETTGSTKIILWWCEQALHTGTAITCVKQGQQQ